MFIARLRPALAGLMLVVFASVASAQDKPTLTHTVSGTTVNLNWTVVPGATSYELFAQIGASTLGPIDVGNSTSVSIPNVPQGVYILAVRGAAGAVKGPFSDPVTVVVGNVAPPAPPAAPSGLAAAINGVSALLSWNLNNPAGSLTSVQLWVATTPGGAPLTALNLGASATSFYIPSAPAGSYYFTVVASGAGGSAASSEFTLTLPGCAAPPTIPLNASTIGTYLTFSWPQLPGANGYALDFANSPGGGANLGTIPFPATVTSFSSYVPEGTYYVTLRSSLSCNGASVSSAETVLTATAPVRGPAKSQAAAGALVLEAVRAITAQYPGDLQNSCRNHTWLFKVIQYLRTRDNRYGAMLNYSGGMPGDIIAYDHSEQPAGQVFAPHLYAWDTISGHCGPNPVPWANDITNPRGQATWTILPYLQAGYRP
jgi:hypothetical protein